MQKIFFIPVIAVLIVACAGIPVSNTGPTPAEYAFIKDACYEVILKKPVVDSLSYDKPLDFSLQDYRLREDEYYSIGTAFAINETDLITAAHVMMVDDKSLVYTDRYIRERRFDGKEYVETVFEIDQVKAFDEGKDYIVFTLKGKTFDTFLQPASDFEFNKTIYTAGNAFGEGVVIRDGVLLDLIPESESGKWNYLKSSIATNPGNSGGPLLDENLNVLGIVLSRKDDFCYAIPLSEIQQGQAIVDRPMFFAFATFNGRIKKSFTERLRLPVSLPELMDWYAEEYSQHYYESMNELMATYEESTFPNGDGSLGALYFSRSSISLGAFLEDSDDKQWFLANPDDSVSEIGNDGLIRWAEMYEDSGVWFMNVIAPEGQTTKELYDDPKLMMDTILKGVKITRRVTNNDPGSRIVSYGEPFASETHADRWGRIWKIDRWLLEYSDTVVMTLSVPTPKGISLIYYSVGSSEDDQLLYDMKLLTDFINVSYVGSIDEWQEFLGEDEYLFGALGDISIEQRIGESVILNTKDFEAVFPNEALEITEENELYLYFDIFKKGNEIVWDLRKTILDDGLDGDSYLLMYRWERPYEGLSKDDAQGWREYVLNQSHPYNRTPYTDEGRTCAGAIHDFFLAEGNILENVNFVYTAFVSKNGKKPDEELSSSLETFMGNITIK
jgi:serine protease Do